MWFLHAVGVLRKDLDIVQIVMEDLAVLFPMFRAIKNCDLPSSTEPQLETTPSNLLNTRTSMSRTLSPFRRRNDPIGNFRLYLHHHPQQVFNHSIPFLLPCSLDALHLLLRILGRVLFCLFVPARVLFSPTYC